MKRGSRYAKDFEVSTRDPVDVFLKMESTGLVFKIIVTLCAKQPTTIDTTIILKTKHEQKEIPLKATVVDEATTAPPRRASQRRTSKPQIQPTMRSPRTKYQLTAVKPRYLTKMSRETPKTATPTPPVRTPVARRSKGPRPSTTTGLTRSTPSTLTRPLTRGGRRGIGQGVGHRQEPSIDTQDDDDFGDFDAEALTKSLHRGRARSKRSVADVLAQPQAEYDTVKKTWVTADKHGPVLPTFGIDRFGEIENDDFEEETEGTDQAKPLQLKTMADASDSTENWGDEDEEEEAAPLHLRLNTADVDMESDIDFGSDEDEEVKPALHIKPAAIVGDGDEESDVDWGSDEDSSPGGINVGNSLLTTGINTGSSARAFHVSAQSWADIKKECALLSRMGARHGVRQLGVEDEAIVHELLVHEQGEAVRRAWRLH